MGATKPDDSRTGNGTQLFIARGKPLVAIVVACATVFVPCGIMINRVVQLEKEIVEIRRELDTVKIKSIEAVGLKDEVGEARAYAFAASKDLALLRAKLEKKGVI